MQAYLDLLEDIMDLGKDRQDRTGVGTRSIFGYQLRMDLQDGFPLLTTKKIHVKSVIHELLWFLRGETNVRSLQAAGVTIWDEWADKDGELGPIYGKQWRAWEFMSGMGPGYLDQIAKLVEDLQKKPFSRRHIVTAWNPADIEEMALPPCHTIWQCQVEEIHGIKYLHLHLYARSIDAFLGLPFNIASYAFLLSMLAKVIGATPSDLIISFGDLHIYRNHFDQVDEQLLRAPRKLPQLILPDELPDEHRTIDGFSFADFQIVDYNPHPAIKAPIAV